MLIEDDDFSDDKDDAKDFDGASEGGGAADEEEEDDKDGNWVCKAADVSFVVTSGVTFVFADSGGLARGGGRCAIYWRALLKKNNST